MSRSIAIAISFVLHPVFINLLAMILLLHLHPVLAYGMSTHAKLFFLGFFFLSGAVFPLLGVVILRVTGGVNSLMLDKPEERRVPYIITALLLMFTFYLFKELGAPTVIQLFCLLCSAIVVVQLIVNNYSKFSIHMASMGLLCGVIITYGTFNDVRLLLIAAILLTGLAGTARLFANAHTSLQLLGGFAVGLLITLFLL
jgi:hypothetical protein